MRSRTVDFGNPVNFAHPLNVSKFGWYLCLGPPVSHGPKWINLCGIKRPSLKDGAPDLIQTGSTVNNTNGWNGPSYNPGRRPGGFAGYYTQVTGLSGLSMGQATSAYDNLAGASFACWLKNGGAGLTTIGAFGPSVQVNYYPYADSNLYFDQMDPASRPVNGFADGSFNKQNWHRLLVSAQTGSGNYKIYRNGVLLTTGTMSGNPTFKTTNTNYIGAFYNNSGQYDGAHDDWCFWTRALTALEAYAEYEASLTGYENGQLNFLAMKSYFFSPVTNATGNANFPTINLTVQTTSESAGSTATASFPTIVLTPQATNVTAAASFPTITLTVQAAAGQGNNTVNVTFPTIVLTVQGATVQASSAASAAFDYSIVLTPPNILIRPDLRVDPPGYLGRYQRSDFLPFVQAFDHLPDAAPTLHIYRGLTLVAAIQIPLIDSTVNVFADELFLGEEYLDGHYVVVTTWTEDGSDQYKIDYFAVRGGTGRAPIHGVIEQRRPLGQAVISVDETGLSRMAYDPQVPV